MAEAAAINKYCYYGLTVATPFVCPELQPSVARPDVIVSCGQIDASDIIWHDEGLCYKAAPGKYQLRVRGVAGYLLSVGKQILIEQSTAADEKTVRHFFYNEVAAALLMQRGMLLLKASVVARNGRAFVLMGKTSVGKSFTAAGLARKGYNIVSDGVCALGIQHGVIVVAPGLPFLMLWQKGLQAHGLSLDQYIPVRGGMNKFYFPATEHFINETQPVAGICLLTEHNRKELSSSAIEGANKLFALLNHQYHPRLADPLGTLDKVHELASITAKQVKMRKIKYNMDANPLDDYLDVLEKELES